MTGVWCLDVLILNLIQIYSYHKPTKTVYYILRLSTGFTIILLSIATYSFILITVKSFYKTRNINQIPLWFKQT